LLKSKKKFAKIFCVSIVVLNISIKEFDTLATKTTKDFVKLNT